MTDYFTLKYLAETLSVLGRVIFGSNRLAFCLVAVTLQVFICYSCYYYSFDYRKVDPTQQHRAIEPSTKQGRAKIVAVLLVAITNQMSKTYRTTTAHQMVQDVLRTSRRWEKNQTRRTTEPNTSNREQSSRETLLKMVAP